MKIKNVLMNELDNIIESVYDDLLIADSEGLILRASRTFGETYGISPRDMIGENVADLERQGYFKPSVTKMVISSKEKVTIKQRNKKGRDIIVTAIPVFDNDKLAYVVSFCRDITDFITLQRRYKTLEDEIEQYREELKLLRKDNIIDADGIVAESDNSIKIMRTIERIADFDATVLLTGNSGVGKSLFAKLIHNRSYRRDKPYVEINCGAIPNNLLESELFGYEAGSFTGASKKGKTGLIEMAGEGTLFLDEVSELPIDLQVKVLKVVQDKKILPVGSTGEIRIDFRLIAASNKNLEEMVSRGLFREDLYYRLKVIPIDIPPLKERREDILHMSMFFVDKFNEIYKLNKSLSHETMEVFQKYEWPGNIRELENLIERLVLTSETDYIGIECLPGEMQHLKGNLDFDDEAVSLPKALERLEEHMVRKAYEQCGTTVGVSKILGISQPTAVRKIKKYLNRQ